MEHHLNQSRTPDDFDLTTHFPSPVLSDGLDAGAATCPGPAVPTNTTAAGVMARRLLDDTPAVATSMGMWVQYGCKAGIVTVLTGLNIMGLQAATRYPDPDTPNADMWSCPSPSWWTPR